MKKDLTYNTARIALFKQKKTVLTLTYEYGQTHAYPRHF
jgi:hypothetical protein